MDKWLKMELYNKYSGLCALSGKPLDGDWVVAALYPKSHPIWMLHEATRSDMGIYGRDADSIENLIPTFKEIKQIKKTHDIEKFRELILKLPRVVANIDEDPVLKTKEKHWNMVKKAHSLFYPKRGGKFTGTFYFEKQIN